MTLDNDKKKEILDKALEDWPDELLCGSLVSEYTDEPKYCVVGYLFKKAWEVDNFSFIFTGSGYDVAYNVANLITNRDKDNSLWHENDSGYHSLNENGDPLYAEFIQKQRSKNMRKIVEQIRRRLDVQM